MWGDGYFNNININSWEDFPSDNQKIDGCQNKLGLATIDLTAKNGGNIASTVKDENFATYTGMVCLGYTNLPSRLSVIINSLYSNKISNFSLS